MTKPISAKISLDHLRHIAEQHFDIRIASDGRWFHEGAQSQQNEIWFQTNIDETVLLDPKHPLQLRAAAQSPDLRPYIEVRDGLLAKLSRPVYYQLADYAEVGPDGRLGIWSHDHFFALEA